MKVARKSFLAVLVGVLLLTIFFTLHTLAVSKVSPETSINSLSPTTSVHDKVVNADSIVYWRSDPDWNTPLTMAQQGVYTGDIVALACYTSGTSIPPNNNSLWYWAEVVSGHSKSSGWMNGYFLSTGTNQPNTPVADVKACPPYPYVWSDTGTANVRMLPGDDSMIYIPGVSSILETLPNSTQRGLFCWVDGGWASGNYLTNRWFQVEAAEADHGYINASLLANQRTTPHCDASMGMLTSTVTLTQGSLASDGTYSYTITVSNFPRTLNPKNTVKISGECYSTVYRSGFAQFTLTTDYYGDGISQNVCPGSVGPDHWVVAGWITSNHVQWKGGSTGNPQQPAVATVTLVQGPVYSGNIYRYAISLSGFPAISPVSVECYDSVSPSGFFHFTITTDGSGNASTQNECFSGDGPDHWVVAGGVTSNHVQWGGGSTNNPPPPTPTTPSIPTPSPIPTTPTSQPVDAYSNYGPANTGYPICRGDPNNSLSMPGGTVSQTFTVPAGVASLNSALVQIDPDSTVAAHMSLAVNGNVVATADAVAAGDTQFSFGPVSVNAGDVIKLSISFTATYGKIITVYTAGSPGGTFTTSDSCPDGASNVSLTNTGLRARVSGMS